MSQSRGSDPRMLARQIRMSQDPEVQLNLLEELVAVVSPTDDVAQAILDELQGDDPVSQIDKIVGLLEQQVAGRENTRELPIGRVGTATENIANGQEGVALFESWSGEVAATVRANEPITKKDTVVVVGDNNLVEETTTVGEVRSVGGETSLNRLAPDQVVRIQNQVYVQSDDTLNPSVSTVSFDGDLQAGDTETVVEVRSGNPRWVVDVNSVGVTQHKDDVDNDNTDESIVRYHYQYQDALNGEWQELPGSPTVLPWGDLANPQDIFDESVIGPMFGFRIRFENRTDNTASQFSVTEEDLGAMLHARVV